MKFGKEDYTIAWICALDLEVTSAVAVLDKEHPPPSAQDEGDKNSYRFGQIGDYNIIIACLPAGVYGITSAAVVVTGLCRSFPSVTACLMVGIGGGAPVLPQRDIRLGDIVVSEPVAGIGLGGVGGVLQYDFGKTMQEGRFVHTGILNKPPQIFLSTLNNLKSEYPERIFKDADDFISKLLSKRLVPGKFARPGLGDDRLFQSNYDHPTDDTSGSCEKCDTAKVVERLRRKQHQSEPYLHYGLIASGNQVMKHGETRDKLSRETGVLCFEMEAAGLMDNLPSLVIRGICDYSDSHKNKVWQPYAALVAAAFAKQLLLRLPPRVKEERRKTEKYNIDLPIAEGAAYGSYEDQHEPECLAGTRTDLLDQIQQWVEDPNGKCLFWMYGMAGTGKSTISRTVAKSLQSSHLGASFFFKRGEADRSSGKRLFTTIAVQLAKYSDGLALSIDQAIKNDSGISGRRLGEQFDKLLFQPLVKLNSDPNRVEQIIVLLIDALDECERKQDIETIIHLLVSLKDIEGGIKIRIFLTSRPDLPIRPAFKRLSDDTFEDLVLHEVPKIQEDISTFIRHELKRTTENSEYRLPENWPEEERTQKLIDMATPLFIYAATLCRFITDNKQHPEQRVRLLTEHDAIKPEPERHNGTSGWQKSQLDKTYLSVLQQIIGKDVDNTDTERIISEFREIVGTIINLTSPLSIPSLARLLSLEEYTIDNLLSHLHSVLDIPKNRHAVVRTFHLSFPNFLSNPGLKSKSEFWIDEKQAHGRITSNCIKLMSRPSPEGLRENICNLTSPGTFKSDIKNEFILQQLPPELRYACRYWAFHLKQSGEQINDNSQVHIFLQKHFLHWVEAMSLLDNLDNVVDILCFLAENNKFKGLSDFLYDAKRFTMQSYSIIDKAPLQLYYSAVLAAPANSIVRRTLGSQKLLWSVRKFHRTRIDEWNSLLQALEGTEASVSSVAFSPDGKIFALAYENDAINLWDSATGRMLQKISVGKDRYSSNNWKHAISFSPNGAVLASGLFMGIKLWDTKTGNLLQRLTEIKGFVLSVAFLLDGKTLASASEGGVVQLWDANTGNLQRTLVGHTGFGYNGTFSPNGEAIASRWGRTIKLWNLGTNNLPESTKISSRRIETPGCLLCSFAFSFDGETLAAVLGDPLSESIRLWDVRTGNLLRKLQGRHTRNTNRVAFSPHDRILASGSYDGTIRLWDTDTGRLLQVLGRHEKAIRTITFSPDGQVLVSGDCGGAVKLWDVAISLELERPLQMPLDRRTMFPDEIALSDDGMTAALMIHKARIELWDIGNETPGTETNETPSRTLNQAGPSLLVVVPSFDDKTLAPVAYGKGIGFPGWRTNSQWLHRVSRSVGKISNKEWSPVSRAFRRQDGLIKFFKFSPDKKILALVYYHGRRTIRLFKAGGGGGERSQGRLGGLREGSSVKLMQVLTGTTGKLNLAFSCDSKTLASGSLHGIIEVWGVGNELVPEVRGIRRARGSGEKMRLLQVLKGHRDRISCLSFSPNGKILASGSDDGAVRIWDVAVKVKKEIGRALQVLEGHASRVAAIAFSADGEVLASASAEGTLTILFLTVNGY
ncbi:hypothetical protein TWF730_000434 [Orbilia blumenaviensis]|uniref:NACHT domain-containing protein n=1 Tax=Orbilia blumenaviensis TaxID=1796055 RepID=A0AAV9VLJ5_9PEZI